MYRIGHCVAGCMTRYLPRGKLSPAEAKEVLRAKPEVLPREIILPKVDNGSCTSLRSDLSILYYALVILTKVAKASRTAGQATACQKVRKVPFSMT